MGFHLLLDLRELHELLRELIGVEWVQRVLVFQLRRQQLQECSEIAGNLGLVERVRYGACAGSCRSGIDGRHVFVLKREYRDRRLVRQGGCKSALSHRSPTAIRLARRVGRCPRRRWSVAGLRIGRATRTITCCRWS